MSLMNNSYLFARGITMKFLEAYPTVESFVADYNKIDLKYIPFKDTNFINVIYYLLAGEYGAGSIFDPSLDIFRYKLMTRVMAYGPELEKELEIQKQLLAMTEEQLQKNVTNEAEYDTAKNPSKKPDSSGSIDYIDNRNTTRQKKSKLGAWSNLIDLLDSDLIARFLAKFADLFTVDMGTEGVYYKPINTGGRLI